MNGPSAHILSARPNLLSIRLILADTGWVILALCGSVGHEKCATEVSQSLFSYKQ